MATTFKIDDLFGVRGKIVVVTGGGTGIGRAIADGFATNGAKVYITGRRGEVIDKAAAEINDRLAGDAGRVIPIQGDVGSKQGAAALVKQIGEKETYIDVLINNAGVQRTINHPPWDHNNPDEVYEALWDGVEDEHFEYTNAVNINGVYFTTVGFVPLLRGSSDPSVIVISSLAALSIQRSVGSVSYSVSKAGALHLAKLLAGRFHPMRIRVNCILPGIFPSQMTTTDASSDAAALGELVTKAARRCTAGRAGRPEEIVGPCLMLSSKAGGYMNGGALLVEGGRLMGASIHDGLRLPEDTYVD